MNSNPTFSANIDSIISKLSELPLSSTPFSHSLSATTAIIGQLPRATTTSSTTGSSTLQLCCVPTYGNPQIHRNQRSLTHVVGAVVFKTIVPLEQPFPRLLTLSIGPTLLRPP